MKHGKIKILFAVTLLMAFLAGYGTSYAMKGSYMDYSKKAFGASSDCKRVLFFHANWCPACKKSNEIISESKLPEGVVVFKVDYDNSSKLKKMYGITHQNTFVQVDSKGHELTKWMGMANDLDKLLK